MKENEHLIETLREAYEDYGEGRKMNMFAVTLACKEAAERRWTRRRGNESETDTV